MQHTTRYSDGALGDLRVLELADEKGQWVGKLMADLGADVIKVEPPGGVAERRVGPFYQDIPHPERSLYFWNYNTSKRGITLNLETADGRALLCKLIPTVDILVETCAPGYLASLGIGYEQLRTLNPRLIMCSITPFGQTGPWRSYGASDLIHLGAGGQMASCGYDEEDVPGAPPIAPGGGNAWHIGCHMALIAITGALCFRDVTGEGQHLDVSIHEACSLHTESAVPVYLDTKQTMRRQTGRHAAVARNAPTQFLCKDGKYLNASWSQRMTPDRFRVLAEWMDSFGQAQDLLDEKYQDAKVIADSASHVEAVLRSFLASITQEEAYHGAQERNFTWGAVRAPEDIVADPHWADRGLFVEVQHPELGQSFTYPAIYAIFSESPLRISRRAPLIGEHNGSIYQELGLSQAEQALLRESGVI